MKVLVACAFAVLLGTASAFADSAVPAAFVPVAFLIGDWSGGGTSDAGPGSGGDSFRLDLDSHVLVRRSHSDYPGGKGMPPEHYEGLMVVYPDTTAPGGMRADAYDNGGHTIHYALVSGSEPNTAQFLSDGTTSRPTFRLTYTLHGGGALDVRFEAARPGSADFQTVAHGIEHRKS
jgi:hypothetical protein